MSKRSIIVEIESTDEGYEQIQELFRTGRLENILKRRVLGVGGATTSSSRYAVKVEVDRGQYQNGLLTYDLLAPERGRSMVLLNAEAYHSRLTPEQGAWLNTLRVYLNDTEKLNAEGRTAQAKSLVKRLHARKLDYPGKAIAVHRFGPVPVLAIDTDEQHILPNGQIVSLRLGLYIGSDRKAGRGRVLPGCPSVVHLLESLKVETTLIFRRYFEDVGEMLWAIRHKANLEHALGWGKQVETVLAESVKTKLDVILALKSKYGGEHKTQRRIAKELRDERAAVVLQAAYGRLLVLYLLNHLYQLLGIQSRIDIYRKELRFFTTDVSPFKAGLISDLFEQEATLNELKRIFEGFNESLDEGYSGPMDLVVSDRSWVRQVAGFARFLTVLHKLGASTPSERAQVLDPRFAKIFFSSVHLVPAGAQVFDALKAAVHDNPKPVRFLAVHEPPDAGFRELIQARLWLSDALVAMLPRESQRFDGTPGDYRWVGEEMALALMTKKIVSIAREEGADLGRISADFEAISSSLFPWANNVEAVIRLTQHFAESVHGEFSVSGPTQPLDPRLKEQLDGLVDEALTRRTDKLVRGFLSLFHPNLLEHLKFLQSARNGVTASYMAERLTQGKQRFRSLIAAASSRAMVLNGVTYPLMKSVRSEKKKPSKYHWMLPEILRALRPWANEVELLEWENELVAWATPEATSQRATG